MNQKPSLPTRAQKSEETKKRIFLTARALFREYGYDNVTIAMITKAAGVSVGSFYHFYPAKEHLLEMMSESVNTMFALPESLDYAKDDCPERIVSFYREFCDRMARHDREYLSDMFLSKGGNKTLMTESRKYRSLMKEMLIGFQKEGKIIRDCDIDELEDIILTCFLGTLYHWANSDFAYPLYEKLQKMLRCVLVGFLS